MKKNQPMKMTQFETIDIDQNLCQFQYSVEYGDELNPDKVYFRVFSIPENPIRWFSYTCKIINENVAKGEMLNSNLNIEFEKKGIPERIIEIASIFLKKTIISSPTIPQAGDYLVGSSRKAWERLVENNKNATLKEENNYFELKYITEIKNEKI